MRGLGPSPSDVTITVLPGSGSREGDEGVNSFKPSKSLLRSPTTGGKKETYDNGNSEGSHNTPKEMTDRGKRYLARRAVEMSSLTRYRKQLPGGSEVKESTVEEIDIVMWKGKRDITLRVTK